MSPDIIEKFHRQQRERLLAYLREIIAGGLKGSNGLQRKMAKDIAIDYLLAVADDRELTELWVHADKIWESKQQD